MSTLLAFEPHVARADAIAFRASCTGVGIATPTPLKRALELLDLADRFTDPPTGSVLDMTDSAARTRITGLAIREHRGGHGGSLTMAHGIDAGADVFRDQVLIELRDAMLPDLDRMIEQLQPEFDTLVKPFTVAAQDYGFSMATTSDDVIDMQDEGASAAWRAARDAWSQVRPIVTFRKLMTKAFQLSPTAEDAEYALGRDEVKRHLVSHSVLFAAGANWTYDETYHLNRKPGAAIDWLALAVGGLHLNTPTEVDAKIQAANSRR